jgi:hypothetical protein
MQLGTFEVKSGKLMVSDPCYSIEKCSHCQIQLDNVKNGTWSAFTKYEDAGMWGNRVHELEARFGACIIKDYQWEEVNETAAVDSGQMGLFDLDMYHGGEDDYDDVNGWYRKCCNYTLDSDGCASSLEGGCVSSSGYGDGSYPCYIAKDADGKIVAVKVVFIDEDEGYVDEYDEDEDDEEDAYDEGDGKDEEDT